MEIYKDYDFKNNNELFAYCVQSRINGQRKQAKEVLSEMVKKVELDQIKLGIVNSYAMAPKATLDFLIEAKDQNENYILSLTNVVNAFYDFDYSNYEKVKTTIQVLTNEYDI